MKILYITVNNNKEARKIGKTLLKKKLANCVNFFPITCIYNYEDKITEEPEIVLLVKTLDGKYEQIRDVVKKELNYDNFIGQLNVEKVNDDFEKMESWQYNNHCNSRDHRCWRAHPEHYPKGDTRKHQED